MDWLPLALAGFPFFAGYYSKDMILEAAWASNSFTGQMAFWFGCAAALLTAFYSWRLLILAFHGKPRCSSEVYDHVHESPPVMIFPLIPLALGAIFAGWFGYQMFVGYDMKYFWGDSLFILPEHHAMEEAHHVAGLGEASTSYFGFNWIWFCYFCISNNPVFAKNISFFCKTNSYFIF